MWRFFCCVIYVQDDNYVYYQNKVIRKHLYVFIHFSFIFSVNLCEEFEFVCSYSGVMIECHILFLNQYMLSFDFPLLVA